MKPIFKHRSTISFALAALMASAAIASTLPFAFTHFGNFKHMSHTGDTAGKVKLSQVPSTKGTWGVGALAGLQGEIVVLDGKVWVSRGADALGRLENAKPEDEAVLFASATHTKWVEVPVPSDMTQAQLESFAISQAKQRGIDTDQAFAFLVDGIYPKLVWHVVTGEKSAGHSASAQTGHGGHGAGHANMQSGLRMFRQPDQAGRLVGIYSGKSLEGVVSHPGERFHLHYVDRDTKVSGHVDDYSVKAGAVLQLPLP